MANISSTAPAPSAERLQLLRVLGPGHVWALGVGIVLVGEYMGWNFAVGKGPFAFIEILIKLFLGWLAGFVGVTAEQGSYCIQNAATSVNAGPNPALQGVGVAGGKGGGRYFNRIWEETAMPHAADPDCRLRVWRKLDEELKLSDKGLLNALGK